MSTDRDNKQEIGSLPGFIEKYVKFANKSPDPHCPDELLPIVTAPIEELDGLVPALLKNGVPGPMDMVEGMRNFILGDFEDRDLSGNKKIDKYGNPIPGNPIEEIANLGGIVKNYWDKAVVSVRAIGKKDNTQTEVADTEASLGGNNALPKNAKQNSWKIS